MPQDPPVAVEAVVVATPDEPEDRDSWTEVRESWVGEPPPEPDVQVVVPASSVEAISSKKSAPPPPLPTSAGAGDGDDTESARICERLMETALEALAGSDYEAALMAASTVLRAQPANLDAVQCAEMAGRELVRRYVTRLGARTSVPHVVPGRSPSPLDPFSLLLLSQVDGRCTVEQLVESANLPLITGLKALSELYLHGFVRLELAIAESGASGT